MKDLREIRLLSLLAALGLLYVGIDRVSLAFPDGRARQLAWL
jgi:hypothetical protein